MDIEKIKWKIESLALLNPETSKNKSDGNSVRYFVAKNFQSLSSKDRIKVVSDAYKLFPKQGNGNMIFRKDAICFICDVFDMPLEWRNMILEKTKTENSGILFAPSNNNYETITREIMFNLFNELSKWIVDGRINDELSQQKYDRDLTCPIARPTISGTRSAFDPEVTLRLNPCHRVAPPCLSGLWAA